MLKGWNKKKGVERKGEAQKLLVKPALHSFTCSSKQLSLLSIHTPAHQGYSACSPFIHLPIKTVQPAFHSFHLGEGYVHSHSIITYFTANVSRYRKYLSSPHNAMQYHSNQSVSSQTLSYDTTSNENAATERDWDIYKFLMTASAYSCVLAFPPRSPVRYLPSARVLKMAV